ncbi:hypothetical protein V6Z11_A01G142100 [Gossypium hirsutum]
MEFESHQAHAMTDASVHAHLVEATSSTPMAEPVRGGHPPSSVRGFDHDYDGSLAPAMASTPSGCAG